MADLVSKKLEVHSIWMAEFLVALSARICAHVLYRSMFDYELQTAGFQDLWSYFVLW